MHRTNSSWMPWTTITSRLRKIGIFAVTSLALFAPEVTKAQGMPQPATATNLQPASRDERRKDVEETQARGGPQEGIKVHGHWVIEVHNPDGSLVSRTEFENAIDPDFGKGHLAGLLQQRATAGHWAIRLGGTRTGFIPPAACTGGSEGSDCWIVQPGSTPPIFSAPTAGISTNLTVGLDSTNERIVFSGSVTVLADGKIDFVNTWQGTCNSNVAPGACTSVQGGPVTLFPLDPPLIVQQGRIIQVTVTISFS